MILVALSFYQRFPSESGFKEMFSHSVTDTASYVYLHSGCMRVQLCMRI